MQTELRKNSLYIMIYNTYGYLIVLIAVPWTVMIVLNVTIVRAVQQAYKQRKFLVEGANTITKLDDKERR